MDNIIAHKVRIYPTKKQAEILNRTFGICRFVYNRSLARKIEEYTDNKVSLSAYDLIKEITPLKVELPWLCGVSIDALQQSVLDLDKAYKNFFKSGKGFPKFKSKRTARLSFRIPKAGKVTSYALRIPKVGMVRYRDSGYDLTDYPIRNMTISKTPSGKYFVSILVERKVCRTHGDAKLGIDLGIKSFAVCSDGSEYKLPESFKNIEQCIVKKQRTLSQKQKGSRRYEKQRILLAKEYERLSSMRSDFLHKLSNKVVGENQTVCVEDLNVKGMLKNRKLARSIQRSAWSMFVTQLEYKMIQSNGFFVQIDRWYPSSKTCSVCGYINTSLTLSDRIWICPECDSSLERDVNAAVNILRAGLALRGEDVRPTCRQPSLKREPQVL